MTRFRRWTLVGAVAVVTVGCSAGAPSAESPGATPEGASTPAPAGSGGERRAGVANPASVHCGEKGGELSIVDRPEGQVGVCAFKDGSRCEEWAYYRGQCAPGQCRQELGDCAAPAP